MFAYCNNNPIAYTDADGVSPYGILTISDYYIIHKQVQIEIVEQYGYAMEVFVFGLGKRGYLDIYDPSTNTFYEVKSIGAAPTAEIQMIRYERSTVHDIRFVGYHIPCSPTRGKQVFSGSFKYGNYLVKYSTNNGLITYCPTWDGTPMRPSEKATALMAVGGAALVCVVALGLGNDWLDRQFR